MERKGFTLIELMVVLVIIIIIATASVPKIQAWTARNRGIAAVSQIISDFSKAKSIAAYSVNANTTNLVNGTFERTRPETSIIFRKSSYTIQQRIGSGAWSPIKQTALPLNVSMGAVNSENTSDSGNSLTLIFTSTGRLKRTNDALVAFDADLGGLTCGGVQSPLDGRKVFGALLKAGIDDDYFFNYRIEIDTAGEFFVCMVTSYKNAEPNFTEDGNILEL